MPDTTRYCLVDDDDGHWYIIPADHIGAWNEWVDNLDPEDERSWEVPWWARGIGGSPSEVTFTDPVIE